MSDLQLSKPLSVDMRAQVCVDAVGLLSDGDWRKRLHTTVAEQIRAAVVQATGKLPTD